MRPRSVDSPLPDGPTIGEKPPASHVDRPDGENRERLAAAGHRFETSRSWIMGWVATIGLSAVQMLSATIFRASAVG